MKKSTIQKEKIDNVGIHSFSKKSNFFFTLLLTLVGLTCVLPFIFVVMISLTDEQSLAVHGFQYKILQALFITLFVTIVGTACNVFITTTYAYAISRSTFKYRKFFTVFSLLSMLFSAGLVPSYIVTTQLLQLGDTIGALIIPMLLSPFNIILMRTFFKRTIPEAILESARIDGASETRIFFQICLPLSLPGNATISLYSALG